MPVFTATIATGLADRDNERFAPTALRDIFDAFSTVITMGFQGEPIGRVLSISVSSASPIAPDVPFSEDASIQVRAELPTGSEGLYIVPQVAWAPEDVREENGIRVYHRVQLMSCGLTRDPADPHLTPLRRE